MSFYSLMIWLDLTGQKGHWWHMLKHSRKDCHFSNTEVCFVWRKIVRSCDRNNQSECSLITYVMVINSKWEIRSLLLVICLEVWCFLWNSLGLFILLFLFETSLPLKCCRIAFVQIAALSQCSFFCIGPTSPYLKSPWNPGPVLQKRMSPHMLLPWCLARSVMWRGYVTGAQPIRMGWTSSVKMPQ